MKARVTCPECESESEFFKGTSYECPNCQADLGPIPEDDFEYDTEINDDEDEEFVRLQSLVKPFFTLNHGKLYLCKLNIFDFDKDELIVEDAFIVPLAFEQNKNNFFVLYLQDEKFFFENPKAIKDFTNMDFTTIWNDGVYGYFDDYHKNPLTKLCATTENGTLLDYNSMMNDFVEVTKETKAK